MTRPAGAALTWLVAALVAGCAPRIPPPRVGAGRAAAEVVGMPLTVTRIAAAPTRDGELDEPEWPLAARTGGFRDASGALARPYSEARFLWRDDTLWVALHAADRDIRAAPRGQERPVWLDDAFSLRLSPDEQGATYLIDVSPAAVVSDAGVASAGARPDARWESGATAAVDVDGTLNDAGDDDEEWFVELAVPLAALGVPARAGAGLAVAIRRCDLPSRPPRCASAVVHLTLSDTTAARVP